MRIAIVSAAGRESGFGHEGTRYVMKRMTDIRHLVINRG